MRDPKGCLFDTLLARLNLFPFSHIASCSMQRTAAVPLKSAITLISRDFETYTLQNQPAEPIVPSSNKRHKIHHGNGRGRR